MQRAAERLAEALLDEGKASRTWLGEGTIIILNGDEDENRATLNGLLGQEKSGPPKVHAPAPASAPGARDQFNIQRGGKRWRFVVHRNDQGQIAEIEASEEE